MSEFGDNRLPLRFWNKVNPNGPLYKGTPCWVWTAAKNPAGYGCFHIGSMIDGSRRMVLAHRFAYFKLIIPIPKGLEPDHLCRNHACVNPIHLEIVTHRINSERGEGLVRAGQNNYMANIYRNKTFCPHGHSYDAINTYINPNTHHRSCRECARQSHRRWWRKNHANS